MHAPLGEPPQALAPVARASRPELFWLGWWLPLGLGATGALLFLLGLAWWPFALAGFFALGSGAGLGYAALDARTPKFQGAAALACEPGHALRVGLAHLGALGYRVSSVGPTEAYLVLPSTYFAEAASRTHVVRIAASGGALVLEASGLVGELTQLDREAFQARLDGWAEAVRATLPGAHAAPPHGVTHVVERQIVVARCTFCGALSPVDGPRCQHCGAAPFC